MSWIHVNCWIGTNSKMYTDWIRWPKQLDVHVLVLYCLLFSCNNKHNFLPPLNHQWTGFEFWDYLVLTWHLLLWQHPLKEIHLQMNTQTTLLRETIKTKRMDVKFKPASGLSTITTSVQSMPLLSLSCPFAPVSGFCKIRESYTVYIKSHQHPIF